MGTHVEQRRFSVLLVAVSLFMALGAVPATAQDAPSPTPDHAKPDGSAVAVSRPANAPTGVLAYAEDTFDFTFLSFDVGQPETPGAIAGTPDYSFAGDSADDGLIYVITDDDLFQSMTVTGMRTTIDTLAATTYTWSGLAWDATTSTMYASRAVDCGGTSELYTIDLDTGATTLVGTVDVADCLIDIAFDDDGDLFGYDILSDMWLSIDPATAVGTEIGPIGFDAYFEQGLDYDSSSDTFYMSAYNLTLGKGELRTVDADTGATTVVGDLQDGHAQYPWLAIEPQVAPAGPTCFGQPVTIMGTAGDDVLEGTAGPDVIAGGDGDDTIRGRGGDDIICGNAGHDSLLGGVGNDQISGGVGDDYLHGGVGDDVLNGGKGDDDLHGKEGADLLKGGGGNDDVRGEEGDDVLNGNSGEDRLFGGPGLDRFNGGPGADKLFANDGLGGETVDGGADLDTCTADVGDMFVNCP